MALGFSPARARKHLDDLITDFPFAKWHTGDPGAAGTANPAANTTRTDLTGKFAAAATVGATTTKASNAEVRIDGVASAEDYSHVSFWSASSAGTFGGSALVTANPLLVGDNFVVPSGGISLTAPNAA
jgi:hypothetical protein